MRLYMVFVGDELRATHRTWKGADAAAARLRRMYWPRILIVETDLPHCETVKTMAAVPAGDT